MNRLIPLLLALVLASSCSFEKPLHFEIKTFTQEDFEICASSRCPTINIEYLEAKEHDAKSTAVNSKIEDILITKITAAEDQPSEFQNIHEALIYFIEDFKQYETDFGNSFISYDVDIFMRVLYQSETFVSIEVNYYLFTGGAHGYSGNTFLNFNAQTGEYLDKSQLFLNEKALLDYCELKFRELYGIAHGRTINATGFWFENNAFHLPETIGFTDSEMIIHYNQYEIASYAEGPIILNIPLIEIEQFIKYR